MVSAGWIRRFLEEKGYRVGDWGTLLKTDHTEVPDAPGVYALYWGETLQYIGKASNLYGRMISHSREDEIPFGSFAWFRLPASQISDAEAELIREYQPPYNVNLADSDW